jgi:hypothetical protein
MRNIFKMLFAVLIINVFILWPIASFADDHGHDSGHHDSGHHDGGHHDHGYVGIGFSVWPDSYYYGAPYYPPVGDVLVSSPVYQPVVINGVTYYLNDGSYYVYNGYGYQPVAPPVVVEPPVTVVQPQVIAPEAAASPVITTLGTTPGDTSDSFTINIPNDKGGYTAVTLKKSGNGYIGPQGEFYTQFPSVAQLKVMYGK